MQGLDQVLGSTGMDVGSLGARFGLSPEQTTAAMGSLMPAVLGGFQKKADAGDLAEVEGAASAIDQPEPAVGNDILGHIFGSKDVSRQVADHAAGQSGVSSTVLKAMLPVVAAMVAKHLAGGAGGAGGGGAGGLPGMLGSILGGGGGGVGGLGGPGGMLGGGSAGSNPLDQILGRLR
jgi:hypothetical protein